MNKLRIALVGSGPSALYLLQNVQRKCDQLRGSIEAITVFEKEAELGVGMPYNRKFTDRYNICNICSEEIPFLDTNFADWLESLDEATRHALGVEGPISAKDTYPRIALGAFFRSQWVSTRTKLEQSGVKVIELPLHEVSDVKDGGNVNAVWLTCKQGGWFAFDQVVIVSGHRWPNLDRPQAHFFSSPWPINKLLPNDGEFCRFKIGLLGASLSAFDVVTSLAQRNGRFLGEGANLEYVPDPRCGEFQLVMHSANGWLPHLQYEQREPFRAVYRHVSKESLNTLIDDRGFLRLETYFDKVCRPALTKAFIRDNRSDMVDRLMHPDFDLQAFVDQMAGEHYYEDAFEGMRSELPQAENSVQKVRPIHWKEVIDDLMYTLNFHAELMSAEDHIILRSVFMPFLMNVIAALPLESAQILLALHDSGRLDLVPGHVEILDTESNETVVSVVRDGSKTTHRYKMFVDCSGQDPVDLDTYPFRSLVLDGSVRAPCVRFAETSAISELDAKERVQVISNADGSFLQLNGIEIDDRFRVVGVDGKANSHIFDVSFPNTVGVRPYAYGLQACNENATRLVDAWCRELQTKPGK